MPYGVEPVTRVELSEPGYWCDVKTRIKVGEALLFASLADTPGPEHFAAVAATIKAWNLDGDDGAVLPINADTVKNLWLEDFTSISDAVTGVSQPRKGKAAVAFTEPSTATSSEEAPLPAAA